MQTVNPSNLEPKSYLALHLVAGAVVASLGFWAFGSLIDAVLDNTMIVRWDVAASQWIHARTSPIGLRVFDIVTQLGSPAAMVVLGAAGALVLWRLQRRTILLAWSAAFLGGALVDWVVKQAVHRTRPPFGSAYLHGHTYSFPSGHSMGSTIGYGMLVYVIRLLWHPRMLVRRLVLVAGIVIIGAVGASRLYLGVHFPSDVVGGYVAGAAWLAICVSGTEIATHRRRGGGQRAPVSE